MPKLHHDVDIISVTKSVSAIDIATEVFGVDMATVDKGQDEYIEVDIAKVICGFFDKEHAEFIENVIGEYFEKDVAMATAPGTTGGQATQDMARPLAKPCCCLNGCPPPLPLPLCTCRTTVFFCTCVKTGFAKKRRRERRGDWGIVAHEKCRRRGGRGYRTFCLHGCRETKGFPHRAEFEKGPHNGPREWQSRLAKGPGGDPVEPKLRALGQQKSYLQTSPN